MAKKLDIYKDDPVWKAGVEHGYATCRAEVLSHLEKCYIGDPGRPDRGTPEANAILKLARDLSAKLKGTK